MSDTSKRPLLGPGQLSAREVAERADAGDPAAREEMQQFFRLIAERPPTGRLPSHISEAFRIEKEATRATLNARIREAMPVPACDPSQVFRSLMRQPHMSRKPDLWRRDHVDDPDYPVKTVKEYRRKLNCEWDMKFAPGCADAADCLTNVLRRDYGRVDGDALERLLGRVACDEKLAWDQLLAWDLSRLAAHVLKTASAPNHTGSKTVNAEDKQGTVRRARHGEEKWRQAQRVMLDRLLARTLPDSLRRTAKALVESYDTVRRAAMRSLLLAAHFELDYEAPRNSSGSILEELAQQAAPQMRTMIERLSREERRRTEAQLKKMSPTQRVELLRTLAKNPDAGRAGDVPLIEEGDSRAQDD